MRLNALLYDYHARKKGQRIVCLLGERNTENSREEITQTNNLSKSTIEHVKIEKKQEITRVYL